VRAAFRKLREEGKAGVIHYGYKFAPVDAPDGTPGAAATGTGGGTGAGAGGRPGA
jgi:hypothetical protein